jgi:hypothetical protein
MERSRAFVKRAADVEAAAAADGGPAGGGQEGMDLEREHSLVTEFRKRLICMVKAFVGDEYNGFRLTTSEALDLQEVSRVGWENNRLFCWMMVVG